MMAQVLRPTRRAWWACCLVALLLGACGQSVTASSPTLAPQPTARSPAPATALPASPQPAGAASAGPQITIDNFTFTPGTLTIAAGTTVTWTNHDDVPHTVTAQDHQFTSAGLDTDDRFSHKFSTAGTYIYYCTIHSTMTARIIVR
jgi:plastocyanin